MDEIEVPMQRGHINKRNLTVAMEPSLREELRILKDDKGVDINEWVRRLIKRELPQLKATVELKRQGASEAG